MQSMTGFGRSEFKNNGDSYSCEIRSLNSRFLEVNVRMPRSLIALEPKILKRTKEILQRGKVDLFIDIHFAHSAANFGQLDRDAVTHYLGLCQEVRAAATAQAIPVESLRLGDFLRLDGVLDNPNAAKDREEFVAKQEKHVFQAVDGALQQLVQSRQVEGASLRPAMEKILDELAQDREAILGKRDSILASLKELQQKRIAALVASWQTQAPSQERMLAEATFLLDKADVEEELTRLTTHLAEFRRTFGAGEGIGRKLDFLCQELHREVNTISNKLVQTEISSHTIAMKQAIERLRQQVQNVE
jgi:uncharacterized protein (TIGR00255 family)